MLHEEHDSTRALADGPSDAEEEPEPAADHPCAGGNGSGGNLPQGGGGVITVTGANRSGWQEDVITLDILTLENSIDPDCESWLDTGAVNNFATFVGRLLTGNNDNPLIGHGSITTTQPNTTVNAVTAPSTAPGFSIVVNDNGAFFNNSSSTDSGKITGGTLRAQVFILLHEFGHANVVPGFQNDANNLAAGNANNLLVEQHCSKTLAAVPNN